MRPDAHRFVHVPDTGRPLPGIVLVDGSGDGDRHDWGGWPEWIGDAGAVVLRHDKPGCGGSPGHWTQQTLDDRARESLAAVEVLRRHPAVSGQPVGLYGISQGGWVALLAAALREPILAEQDRHADRAWYSIVTRGAYDDAAVLGFVSRIFDFDPVAVLPDVPCPVLALFGGADTVIPVPASVAAFGTHLLPHSPEHGLAVFPGADHGMFLAGPDPAVPRRDQLAPAYLPTLTAFLDRRHH